MLIKGKDEIINDQGGYDDVGTTGSQGFSSPYEGGSYEQSSPSTADL